MPAFRTVSYIGEDTDLLLLLLYHAKVPKCSALDLYSNRVKSYIYNIKVLKQVLGIIKQIAMTYCFCMALLDATRCAC